MKYFEIDIFKNECDEDKFEGKFEAYKRYVNSIYEKIPFTIKLLARSIPLHDGKIKSIHIDSSNNKLEITIICGSNFAGYFEINILLKDACYDTNEIEALEGKSLEILYTEWELLEKGYNYKILFYPYHEISIDSSEVNIEMSTKNMDDFLEFSTGVKIQKT